MTAHRLCLALLAAACALAWGRVFSAAVLPGDPGDFVPLAGAVFLALLLFFLPGMARRLPARDGAERSCPDEADRLYSMALWSLTVALSFSMMGFGMLHEDAVSRRVAIAGWTAVSFSALCAASAFIGIALPRLYAPLAGLALFFIWLIVPVAGMEAYLHAESGGGSAYAASHWRWTYVFCATGAAAAVRLLLLRPRRNPPDADSRL